MADIGVGPAGVMGDQLDQFFFGRFLVKRDGLGLGQGRPAIHHVGRLPYPALKIYEGNDPSAQTIFLMTG